MARALPTAILVAHDDHGALIGFQEEFRNRGIGRELWQTRIRITDGLRPSAVGRVVNLRPIANRPPEVGFHPPGGPQHSEGPAEGVILKWR